MSSTHAEILAEYQELRAVQRALNKVLTGTLSRKAYEQTARELGFWLDGRIDLHEAEIPFYNESALYDYYPTEKNAVERYASRKLHAPESLEHRVLEAMRKAWVTLVELGRPTWGVGVDARDLLFGGEFFLADIELSKGDFAGVILVARLLAFPRFCMTGGGVAYNVERDIAALVAESIHATLPRNSDAATLESRTRSRIGARLFRIARLDPEDARAALDNGRAAPRLL